MYADGSTAARALYVRARYINITDVVHVFRHRPITLQSQGKCFIQKLRTVNRNKKAQESCCRTDRQRYRNDPPMPVLHFPGSNDDLDDRQDHVKGKSYDDDHTRDRTAAVPIKVKTGVLEQQIPDNRRQNKRPDYLYDEID